MTDINESVSVLTSVLVGEKSMNWLTRNLNLADDLILLMFNEANGSDFLHFLALQIYLPFVNRIISLFVSFLIVFFFHISPFPLVPPSIPQQNPITQQILKTYTTYLTCVTSGTPPPRIDWYKFESLGGKFVPVQMENPRFRKMLNGTLVIRDVRGDDDGTYSCAAYNAVFDDRPSSQVRLIVHGIKNLDSENRNFCH